MNNQYKKAVFILAFCIFSVLGCRRVSETETLSAGPETAGSVTESPENIPEDSARNEVSGTVIQTENAANVDPQLPLFSGSAGAVQNTKERTATGANTGTAGNRPGESSVSLSSIKSRPGRGVFIGELNPVNYKTVDPAVLLQMGMEQYQVSFIMGERYLGEGKYDRALAEYNKAISLKPDYAEALFSRGRTYQLKNELNRAVEDYTKTISLKKDSAAAYNHRGYIHAQRGDHVRAQGDYTQALAIKRDYGDALYNRGCSYRIQGLYDKAIEDFTRLLQIEPNNHAAYNQRGTAWYYKENDERAVRDFSEAIRIKPDYALAWHNRGTAYRAMGNAGKAGTDLAEAARLGYR